MYHAVPITHRINLFPHSCSLRQLLAIPLPYKSFLADLLAAADTLLKLADLTLAAEDKLEADLLATL